MNNPDTSRTPWHFWLMAVFMLAWNGFGGFDYVMTRRHDRDYLAPMTEPYGVRFEDLVAWFDDFPFLVDVCWGLGVWASVAAALLFAARRGLALYALVLSLVGQIGTLAWQFSHPLAGATDTPMAYAMSAVVALVMLFEIWYCRAMIARGVLG